MSLPPALLTCWDGKTDYVVGDEKDNSKFYLKIECQSSVFWNKSIIGKQFLVQESDLKQSVPVVLLGSIFVPEKERKQGIATKIINQIHSILLKRYQSDPSFVFGIGPLVGENDALIHICKKIGGFYSCMPWSLVKTEFSK